MTYPAGYLKWLESLESRFNITAGDIWEAAQAAERERAKECITELLDYAQHDSWRCGYNGECHCGLNTITERYGLPAVPLPEKGERT
jgi:hypothetical protein